MKVKKLNQIMKIPLLLGLFFFLPSMMLVAQNDLEIATEGENSTSTTSLNFCCPGIKSVTMATQPSNTSRTKLGIGEEVMLSIEEPSFSGTVTWEIVSGDGDISQTTGNSTMFTASEIEGETEIRALLEGTSNCNQQIKFTIIAPTEIRFGCPPVDQQGCLHLPLVPSGGAKLQPYIFPDDVSFYKLEIQEQFVPISQFTHEDYWTTQVNNGDTNDHPQGLFRAALGEVEPTLGTKLNTLDNVGFRGEQVSLQGLGLLEISIPIKYRVGDAGTEFLMSNPSIQGIDSFSEVSGSVIIYKDEVYKGNTNGYFTKDYERNDDYWDGSLNIYFTCASDDLYDCN